MNIKNYRHTGIVTTNLEESLNFYINLLGFKKLKTANEDEKLMKKILSLKKCKLKTVKIGLKNKILIELLYFKNLNKKKRSIKIFDPGLTHISLTVKNLEQIYKRLKTSKISFLSEPSLSHDKKVKLVFCKSPENIFIELVEVL
tara:strand:- start:465 stop:896 length:432 start_codon:yes stop_codon:yes gene_type:complete